MENVLLIGHSGGIGSALQSALWNRGTSVTALSRSTDGLDITSEDSVIDACAALEPQSFDAVIIASGALDINGAQPEKSLSQLTPEAMIDQFKVNTIGPALVLKHTRRVLVKDRRSLVVALSARVGSIGDNRLGGWYSYRSAKAALNQIIRSSAIELARTHPQAVCIALHPGTVRTNFTRKYLGRHPAVDPQEAAANLLQVLGGLTAGDSGQFFDWSGKNIPW
ncbi:MAG: SDR family NAD(P)-dependent oxidoreductase [Paracoccaceae bacterium]|nr:SDR family NAD(P)-dependent oxidoreductase [Marinovum sp.]MBT6508761.1 SDR family NAD(P)-dependent oxidoreductase [Marinovum sp.]MBT7906127.1 SDR family NAD(P)-dependent oxidoreductase [Marinovum sp.]MDG1423892.1 SDR family NAD(P)-dependent oxidoreductase [Paracoccaceae bacterium]